MFWLDTAEIGPGGLWNDRADSRIVGPSVQGEPKGGNVNIVSIVTRMFDPVRNMWNKRDQIGASLVEYALLLALIAVVALVALHFLGTSVNNTLQNVANQVNTP
jgi:pilus assembly protein Flp/PilA